MKKAMVFMLAVKLCVSAVSALAQTPGQQPPNNPRWVR